MPELPEVHTISTYLNSHLVGKKISAIQILKAKSFIGKPRDIIGRKILGVERRAKLLLISLGEKSDESKATLRTLKKTEGTEKILLIHLKMSGQLIYKLKVQSEKLKITVKSLKLKEINTEKLIDKYTRIVVSFSDGSRLFFNDLRIFGWMRIVDGDEKWEMGKFGPEPFSKEFTEEYLQKIFSGTKKPIKLILMDQTKIAGIGNIYSNEILFDARIRPDKPAQQLNNLPAGEAGLIIKQLKNSIIKILEAAIRYKGSSAEDEQYIQANGEKGSYQKHFLVYQRDGKKCKRCDTLIKRSKIGGRGTFWCEKCQK